MAFKPKVSKSIHVDAKDITTLDSKHDEFLKKFENDEKKVIPQLESKKELLLLKIEKKTLGFQEQTDLIEEVKMLSKRIKSLKTAKKKYYLKNANYIFDYFEEKKNISADENKPRILDAFFGKDKRNNQQKVKQHTNIVTKYLVNTDDSFLEVNDYIYNKELCTFCKEGQLIPIDYEGIMVCNKCYKQTPYLIDNEKPSYKEPPKEVCFYAYKRINHFREILAQIQAKETTQIPDNLIASVKNQIRKERLTLKDLSNERTKEMLKKLGYNKYYEHIPYIKDRLGIKPPVMSQELEEKLCSLFLEIQRPYSRFCPDNRVNFLNYYYTIYKLCEMLGQRQFLSYFPMLKDREKQIEQDEVWKKICDALDWPFIPTI
jgi:hypothetical protein